MNLGRLEPILKDFLRSKGLWIVKSGTNVNGSDFTGDLRRLYPYPTNLLDVGANVGQSIEFYSTIWPEVRIFSIEPDPDNFTTLENCKHPNSAGIANVGLAEVEGELLLNRFGMSVLNSFLDPSQAADSPMNMQPTTSSVSVSVVRPTSKQFEKLFNESRMDVIKIDTQGYDLRILKSFDKSVIASCKVLIIEINFDPMYDEQPSAASVIEYCYTLGFKLVSNYEITRNGLGAISWATAVFVK
jgi:FkbM family methyltransferase